jgi:hypothetical protein
MPVQNPWVGYLDRSYQQIKASLLNRLGIHVPEVTDHSSSNILVIILEMFAGVAEMLGLYIDNMCREAFLATARRFSSVVRLTKLLDYRIKACTPASTDLVLTFDTPATGIGIIPLNTMFQSLNGLVFRTLKTYIVNPGDTSIVIGVSELSPVSNVSLGVTTGLPNQAFSLPSNYVHDSITVSINLDLWLRVNSLGLSKPFDKHYVVEIDVDGVAYLKFGDGQNGAIPPIGNTVVANFYTTLGEGGNLDKNLITQAISPINIPGVSNISITNPNPATGGSSFETIERIRVSAPLSIRTLDRAVTRQDYIDIAKLAPGVGKAAVYFECGKDFDIYIVPIGGGIANTPLLDSTQQWMDGRKMITTFISVLPAGPTRIHAKIVATVKFRQDPILALQDIKDALSFWFSYQNQDINKRIRVSDLYALIDNLARVDFLELSELYTIPYAKPRGHTNQLVWQRKTLPASNSRTVWKLEYVLVGATPSMRIIKSGLYLTTIPLGTTFTDLEQTFQFTPGFGVYTVGNQWEFVVYPYNTDIVLDDYTIPSIDLGDFDIEIKTQITEPVY